MRQKTPAVNDIQLKRKRKFLLVLPLFIIPCMTLLLWSVGIIGSADAKTTKNTTPSGFNFHLPNATQAKDSKWNKMQYYAQAEKDSERLKSLLQGYSDDSIKKGMAGTYFTRNENVSGVVANDDPKEKLIEEKIAALNQKLNQPVKPKITIDPESSSYENEIPEPTQAQKQAAIKRIREEKQWLAKTSLDTDQDNEPESARDLSL